MITNNELKLIEDTIAILKQQPDSTDYIQKLQDMHDKYVMQKKIASDKSNAYNKANPEKHRRLCRESARRHRDRVKKYQKEYQQEYFQKNKKRITEYRKKHYHEIKRQQIS